jgi:phosphoglycerate dehydrogenase-like enzyme
MISGLSCGLNTMKLVIVIYHRFSLWAAPEWFAERLRAEFPELEVVHLRSYGDLGQHIRDTDILMTWSIRPEQVLVARKLKWIYSPAAAVHALLIPEIVNSEIVVTNGSDVHGGVVAEHAIALVLAMAKRLPSAVRHQRDKRWAQEAIWNEQPRPREVKGATLLVIGLGTIGRGVAEMASALGMHVVAVRENPQKGAGAAHEVLGFEQLNDALPTADFVVLAAPLTEKTRAFIGAEQFARMKREAYFINVSRGALVDEPAMVNALQSGTIGGAALDVFAEEPLPPESSLWELPNVLITPHSAAFTDQQWERHYDLFCENYRRFKAGEPLLSVVDKRRGY